MLPVRTPGGMRADIFRVLPDASVSSTVLRTPRIASKIDIETSISEMPETCVPEAAVFGLRFRSRSLNDLSRFRDDAARPESEEALGLGGRVAASGSLLLAVLRGEGSPAAFCVPEEGAGFAV